MRFRKDINALRAIAVMAVVISHFNTSWMPGGFAGVDVFFVISGFLMTAIIFNGLNKSTFSLLKFYKSRAKRILPALSFVCLFSILFGYFFLYDKEFKGTINQIISSISFSSNFYFWKGASYFSPVSESKMLLHTWSLSTEWQFYIIYPLVLFMLSKVFNLKVIKLLVVFGFLTNFVFSVYASPQWASSSYYLLPTRSWEMLLGGIAYFNTFKLNENKQNVLSATGLVLIITSFFIMSKDDVWPGYLALLPTFGAFLVLLGKSEFFILKNKLIQLIGTYSYSIYLWHWIVVYILYRYTSMNGLVVIFGGGLSFVLGYFSYEIIEKKGFNRLNKYFILSSYFLAFMFYSSFEMIIKNRMISNTKSNVIVNYYSNKVELPAPWVDNLCSKGKKCVSGGVFLWGDSHAQRLYLGLKNINISNLSVVTTKSCPPSLTYPDYKLKSRIICNKNNKEAIEQIALKIPDIVILARRFRHENTNWNLISSKLKTLGVKTVIVFGPMPQYRGELPQLVARKYMENHLINKIDMDGTIFKSNEIINNVSNKNYTYIDILSELCSSKGCLFQSEVGNNYKLISSDYGHLNQNGSEFIVNKFVLKLLRT